MTLDASSNRRRPATPCASSPRVRRTPDDTCVRMAIPEPPPPATLAAVAVKLPQFWPADPAVWFAQVEAQFSTRTITQQRTRFDHVIAALSPDVAMEVRDLVLHPPEEQAYDKLKEQLIKRTEASEQRRLQQLLTAEELGDRKPTQLLRRMQQLLGDSGPAPDSAFIRQLFLQRLPPHVRMVLASSSANFTLAELAEMADRIVEVATPASVAHVSQESPILDEVRQLTATLNNMVAALNASPLATSRSRDSSPHARSSRPSTPRQSRSSSPSSDFCWYHRRYGPDARKCRQPCSYSGNAPASR